MDWLPFEIWFPYALAIGGVIANIAAFLIRRKQERNSAIAQTASNIAESYSQLVEDYGRRIESLERNEKKLEQENEKLKERIQELEQIKIILERKIENLEKKNGIES
jgi:predicted RNase H-like nuclease (RuvC/YqgF family)